MRSKSTPNCVCQTCGKPFHVKPSRLTSGRGKYCSKMCWYGRNGTVTGTCDYCSEPFSRPNWHQFRDAKYCSLDCYAEARRSLSPTEREALMAGARDATRGLIQTDEHRHKIARTKQERCVLSGDEAEIMAAFEDAGLHPIPLYAVHRYNIDFAFPEQMLAVEYNGGNWHNSPKKRAQDKRKADYLRAHGWTLIVFPRIEKPQANNAGNRRIAIAEIVRQVQDALKHR